MEPVNSTAESFTCESCGAPLTSLTVPCPYCGHMPPHPVQADEGTESVDLRPREAAVVSTPGESTAIKRGVRDGCIVGIAAAVIGTILVIVLVWVFVSIL